MAKWQSVLFSDIRNKLGDQVIFSAWKGRTYMRTYFKPSNPNTPAQKAQRELIRNLVERWKQISQDINVKNAWNAVAQDLNISGYNLFIKEGGNTDIETQQTATGTGSATITITYSLGFNPADAIIVRVNPDGSLTDITPTEGLLHNGTITDTITESGTYYYFVGDKRVLIEGDTPPQNYQLITKYKRDKINGKIIEAKTEVTIT